MSTFDEYSPSDKDAELTLAGDLKESTQFKIYVFTKNLEKELKTLNDLLLKHEGNNYEEFSVCPDVVFYLKDLLVLFQEEKSEVKMSFNFLVNL